MSKKIINIIFISIFIFIIFVPLFFTNLKPNTMSKSEKRYLVKPAQLYTQDGNLNTHFIKDFENWFNDNMGFRSYLVTMNANIQFYLFDRIERKDMHLGPNKELNYATDAILKDYQHNNLKSEDELNEIASSFQIINDYLKSKNIQYYYVQCFDKHSIYPEYFSNHVNQYGDISKTDQIMKKLSDSTNISFISMKDILKNEKENYEVYSKWGDPTHWSQRGAYIGYLSLMDLINKNNNNLYKILQEEDYTITNIDQGQTLFGSIHQKQLLEDFQIKNPQAVKTNNKLHLYSDDQRHSFFTNNSVDNKTRVLILGDSYFNGFIVDDIAESFHETIMIWGDYTKHFIQIIEEYQPDIVIHENVERVDRFHNIVKVANAITDLEKQES